MFSPRSDDIYLAGYPRSGTTLAQMILHQLLTGGEMTFEHISDVIPFLERSLRSGCDLDSLPAPRVLKTHLPYKQVSLWPGRYIYLCRDGRDVLLSYFRMYQDYVNPRTEFPAFFEGFLSGRLHCGSWFQHVATWTTQRGSRVLIVRYEDLIQDMRSQVERIASFIDVPLLPEKYAALAARCSFAFMQTHEAKFAPDAPSVMAPPRPGAFIRQGKAGSWRESLAEEQQVAFEQVARTHGIACGAT